MLESFENMFHSNLCLSSNIIMQQEKSSFTCIIANKDLGPLQVFLIYQHNTQMTSIIHLSVIHLSVKIIKSKRPIL